MLRPSLGLALLLCALAAPSSGRKCRADEAAPRFDRDVRPLLAKHCLPCHGPDREDRKSDLRLDVRDVAMSTKAIVPGAPDRSELVRRIASTDPDVRMPPAPKPPLTDAEQKLLRRWIAAGADYEPHWAFVAPRRPPVPAVRATDAIRNPIDAFVQARLEREGLDPAPEADRYALARRVALDLIGLPPTPEEADEFAADPSPDAYERYVDRLLASPHYGERWARAWLDLARYADTNGYEKDRPRSIWPYRDWVVRALGADLPFDRFTIEQLAGDMLPDATPDQRIATGFHRNTMLNEEGGIDPLEYRFHAMTDRTAVTGLVWMGLTTGCAQCHSHKYDPITHVDYYRLFALLDNADEPDLVVPDPTIAEQRSAVDREIARLSAELPDRFPPDAGEGPVEARRAQAVERRYAEWLKESRAQAVAWRTLRPARMTSNLPRLELLEDGSIFSSGDITKRDLFTLAVEPTGFDGPVTALRLEVLPDDRLPAGGPGRAYYEGRRGDFFLSELTVAIDGRPVRFASASRSYGKIAVGSGDADAENVIDGDASTGWSTAGREGEPHRLVLIPATPLPPTGAWTIELLFERHFAASLGRFRLSATSTVTADPPVADETPSDVERLLIGDPARWTERDRERLRQHFFAVAPELAAARKQIDDLRRKRPAFPTTLVFQERPADHPRPTYRHHRGEYLSPREAVAPGVPAFLPPLPEGEPANRLTFARWLTSGRNPLVARVAADRAWRAFFGAGLVRTNGDYGTQSEPPTHPDLLDWLACEFVDGGWSQKRLHRTIVTSATYRRRSHVVPELLARDPENRLLARGPRHRLDAEAIRDAMLRASGLLAATFGGPGVYPPQPDSVTALAYGDVRWTPSQGPDRYRRSLYTFSKRTAPFAAYLAFDGPTGESCVPRRDRSNTPLQALTLLNDGMFLELARALAEQALHASDEDRTRAVHVFRRILTRPPRDDEVATLLAFHDAQRARLVAGDLDAATIAGPDATAELAAWTMTARVVMNLDEAIVKP